MTPRRVVSAEYRGMLSGVIVSLLVVGVARCAPRDCLGRVLGRGRAVSHLRSADMVRIPPWQIRTERLRHRPDHPHHLQFHRKMQLSLRLSWSQPLASLHSAVCELNLRRHAVAVPRLPIGVRLVNGSCQAQATLWCDP